MKKLLLLLFLLTGYAYSQNKPKSADDTVFDRFGNSYKVSDLQASPTQAECSAGYFSLIFLTGSDMDNTSNSAHNNRRAVVCQVFKDLSNFINSPLPQNGSIRIRFGDIDALVSSHIGLLGAASGVYIDPASPTKGGITDNEIWRSLKTGVINPGYYFNGIAAFNFKTDNNPAIVWNTNMNITSPVGSYDLYSVVLHEAMHMLGFNSLLNENGSSTLGETNLKYYSRYDTFLRSNDLSKTIITNGGAQPSTMYNFGFNTANNVTILRPGCLLQPPIATGSSNSTNCPTAIRYFGISNIPVYTPVCYERGSSFSHFEDQCYVPPAGFPTGNDAYFVMSNAQSNGSPPNNPINTKRTLRQEEKNALCDIGYNVKADYTFGFGTATPIITNLGSACTGIVVSGVDDGISEQIYSFTGDAGADIVISGILSNDRGPSGIGDVNLSFEGLEDFNDPKARFNTNLTSISGNAATVVNFKSNVIGQHILRYVPVIGTQKGNITYVKVFVRRVSNCQLPSSTCEFVINGGFEENTGIPTNYSQFDKVCGWDIVGETTPDYFHVSGSGNAAIPCNALGNESTANSGNIAYAGMFATYYTPYSQANELIKTKLRYSLQANTQYRLSFIVSLGEASSAKPMKFQALISSKNYSTLGGNYLPITGTDILLNNNTFSTIASGWEVITMNFTTGGTAGQQYLYLGGINNTQYTVASPSTFPSCNYSSLYPTETYYYIDNVSLVPATSVTLNLPLSVCQTQLLSNLNSYVSPATTGTFSGPGVTGTTFNAAIAGLGTKVISFNYSELGCSKTIYRNITVSPCSTTSCPGNLIFNTTEQSTLATYQAKFTIATNTNYLVNAGSTITLKAGNSITFSPSSEVKVNSTSNFTAQIADCTQTSQRVMEDENPTKKVSTMIISPNPTNGYTTIRMNDALFNKIIISTIDGRIVYTEVMKETSEYEYDTSNLTKGIYIISIETNDGELISKKLIKK